MAIHNLKFAIQNCNNTKLSIPTIAAGHGHTLQN